MSERRLSPAETWPEPLPDESAAAWTDRLARTGRNMGVFRQCSIGWHGDCSDPFGFECRCLCHA